MATPTTQPCFRGQALSGILDAARRLDGERLDEVLDRRASDALRETVVGLEARAWYPAQAHLELLQLLLKEVARDDPDRLTELARDAVHHDLRGVYRMLLKVVSPSWLVARADRFFRAYLNYGRISVTERTMCSARLRFEMSPSSEALWVGTQGAIRGALESAGGDAVQVVREDADEPDVCFYRVQWA